MSYVDMYDSYIYIYTCGFVHVSSSNQAEVWNLLLDRPYSDGGGEFSGRVAKQGAKFKEMAIDLFDDDAAADDDDDDDDDEDENCDL